MKSKLKWVSGVLGAVLALSLVFGAGVYASQWLNFTGKEQIERSESDVDKIMQILEDVNNGKITAENAIPALEKRIKELEDMNPSGLAKLNKELREENEQLKTDNGILSTDLASKDTQLRKQSETIEKLNSDLTSANQAKIDAENALTGKEQELESKQQEINNKQSEIEAKQAEINEKNQAYDKLQQQRDAIATERNNYKAQVDENNNYVHHLEAELEKANKAAQSVSNKTSEALEKAETYK